MYGGSDPPSNVVVPITKLQTLELIQAEEADIKSTHKRLPPESSTDSFVDKAFFGWAALIAIKLLNQWNNEKEWFEGISRLT